MIVFGNKIPDRGSSFSSRNHGEGESRLDIVLIQNEQTTICENFKSYKVLLVKQCLDRL